MKKRISNNKINIELTLLCLPTIIWYIAFCYLPVFGIVLAFKRYQLVPGRNFFYSLFFGSKWVGLSNFRFLMLLNLGHILSTDFGLFYQVTRNAGSILSTTETIDVFVYKALMEQSNYGFSAAASLIQNGIGCLLLIVANRMVKAISPEGGAI